MNGLSTINVSLMTLSNPATEEKVAKLISLAIYRAWFHFNVFASNKYLTICTNTFFS
jgi:hypothetical protein